MIGKLDRLHWDEFDPEEMQSSTLEYHRHRAKGEATIDLSSTGVIKWTVSWEEYQLYFGGDTYHKGAIHMPHVASSDRNYEICIQQLDSGYWWVDGLCYSGHGIKKYEPLGTERAAAIVKAIRGIGGHVECEMLRSVENIYDFHYEVRAI